MLKGADTRREGGDVYFTKSRTKHSFWLKFSEDWVWFLRKFLRPKNQLFIDEISSSRGSKYLGSKTIFGASALKLGIRNAVDDRSSPKKFQVEILKNVRVLDCWKLEKLEFRNSNF